MTKKAKIDRKWENRYLGKSWSKKARDRYKRRVESGQPHGVILLYCRWLYFVDNKRHPQGALIAARIAKKIHRENRKKYLTNPH